MKIGFSFGRCLRDIVTEKVRYDEVYLIVSRTLMRDSTHVEGVIEEYLFRPDYLMGLDETKCYEVGRRLYLNGKLYQPRAYGHSPRMVAENALWMDLAPCILGPDDDGMDPHHAEQVMQAWKSYQLALKMTSLRRFPDINLKDDF